MKFGTCNRVITVTLLLTLAIPARLAAQAPAPTNHLYQLIDLGTLGGPFSNYSGPSLQVFNNKGTAAAYANTPAPNPNPNCFVPFNDNDCFVEHPIIWHDGAVTDLGVLPGGVNGQTDYLATNGLIAGWSEDGLIDPLLGLPEAHAVLWTQSRKIIDLGALPGGNESLATAMNSGGQVVGFSNNDVPEDPSVSLTGLPTQTRAFLWQNGAMQDLGTLGGTDGLPFYINERGQVSGFSFTNSDATLSPFFWQNGTMTDIGTLGGTFGQPNGLNRRGQVAGLSTLAGDANNHPFFWDRGVLTDIGTFGGSNGEADDISDSGMVVGTADFAGDFIHHAFVWKNGVMTDVGVVPGDSCTNGRAVNSKGQAIGTSTNCMGVVQHLFLWESGSIFDLGALILGGTDLTFQEAFDINDRGEIAARGMLPNGEQHAVVLVPASEAEIAAAGALAVAKAAPAAPRRVATTSRDSAFGGRTRKQYALRSVQP